MKETVPLVFAANDAFIPYLSVMIESILDHADSARTYEIIVLFSDISSAYRSMLEKQLCAFPNFSIRFLPVPAAAAKGHFYIENQNNISFSKEAYYRLLAPFLLPEYDKAIYLDGDMVALRDIGLLWEIPLGDRYIAAVRDFCGLSDLYDPESDRRRYMTEELHLTNPDNYYISGLLIMNLARFRREFSAGQMMQIALERDWRFHDQDVLNVLTQSDTLLLDSRWNVLQDYGKHHYMPERLYREWEESTREPYVVHYGGSYKPWNSPKVPRRQYFWKYAARTEFYRIIRTTRRKTINRSLRTWVKYWSQYPFPLHSSSREFLKAVTAPLWKR